MKDDSLPWLSLSDRFLLESEYGIRVSVSGIRVEGPESPRIFFVTIIGLKRGMISSIREDKAVDLITDLGVGGFAEYLRIQVLFEGFPIDVLH